MVNRETMMTLRRMGKATCALFWNPNFIDRLCTKTCQATDFILISTSSREEKRKRSRGEHRAICGTRNNLTRQNEKGVIFIKPQDHGPRRSVARGI